MHAFHSQKIRQCPAVLGSLTLSNHRWKSVVSPNILSNSSSCNGVPFSSYLSIALRSRSLVGGAYPNALAMTPAAVNQPLLDLVYLPTLLVQPSPQINLILIPFEMVFVTLLSLLVASNVTMAYYLISSKSALSCSTKGTVLSTSGSFLGLTATCPTCLAPTIVSVIFGSVSTAATIFSNFNGVVVPPVLSVGILLVSTAYLSRAIKKRAGINFGH